MEPKGPKMTEEENKQYKEVFISLCYSSEDTAMIRSRRIKWPNCVEHTEENYVNGSRKSLGEETPCENPM